MKPRTQREAWKKVSRLYDAGKASSGLCFMFIKCARLRDGRFICGQIARWAKCGGPDDFLFPTTHKYDGVRATIAALFAAMTDKERAEVLQ